MNSIKTFFADIWELTTNCTDRALESTKQYLYNATIGEATKEFKIALGAYANDLQYIFLFIALIGFYCVITGNRQLGTKITSFAFITYFISRLVMASYGY